MLTPREFTNKIEKDCEELYQYHENSVKSYFDAKPSKEEMIGYFSRRMINERMNCTQISKRVAALPYDTPAEEMFLLSKQALDEAKHFQYVKDIVEDMLGHEVDVAATLEDIRVAQLNSEYETIRPAELLERFECADDPLALAIYQFIAEGMAHRNWVMQAKCAPNKLIAEKYEEIARDEKFHASLGRRSLEQLVTDEETQAKAQKLADQFIEILWDLRCIKQHIPMSELHA
jgi:ribonucleotide reductase beta subunit family protein with ferritin-like domain